MRVTPCTDTDTQTQSESHFSVCRSSSFAHRKVNCFRSFYWMTASAHYSPYSFRLSAGSTFSIYITTFDFEFLPTYALFLYMCIVSKHILLWSIVVFLCEFYVVSLISVVFWNNCTKSIRFIEIDFFELHLSSINICLSSTNTAVRAAKKLDVCALTAIDKKMLNQVFLFDKNGPFNCF